MMHNSFNKLTSISIGLKNKWIRISNPFRLFSDLNINSDMNTKLTNSLRNNNNSSSIVIPYNSIPDPKSIISPWKEVKDPQGSNLSYYWNTITNETTPLGSVKPLHWVEVQSDPKISNLTYWWNPETNMTTPVGAPKPLMNNIQNNTINIEPTTGGMIKSYFILGASVALGSIFIRLLFGF